MLRLRRAFGLLAASALFAAQLAVPGLTVARTAAPAWACTPDAGSITARGGIADSRGTVREKDTGQVVHELPASAINAAPADLTVSVPIYFHVITSGTTGDLTDRQLRAQVAQMNSAYSGTYGGVGTGFSWTFAGVDRTNNPTWYASKSAGAEHAMKQALKIGGDNVLNVYTDERRRLPRLGVPARDHRHRPGLPRRHRHRLADRPGRVRPSTRACYDEGDTLVHEAGHWLNLEHTFFGQCNKTATTSTTRRPRSRRRSAAR